MSKWDDARFFTWDGEGATIAGAHRYILMRTGAGDVLEDAEGLDSARLLAFVTDVLAREPKAIHVGYGFSYDANMLLGDVPRELVQAIWAGYAVRWGPYHLRYRPRKSFHVHRVVWDAEALRWEKRGGVIWDVLGFFQARFVEALREYGVTDDATLAMLDRMKARRSTFKPSQLPEINKYCALELDLLERLMMTLKDHLTTAGLKVARWDGAGAVAAALLTRQGVKASLGPRAHDALPRNLTLAIRAAYAGGRIECLKYGHTTRTVYHADLRSAYPHATTSLPCLAHGRWRRLKGEPAGFALVRVRWRFELGAEAYPFFWRAWDGSIYFPAEGEGFYWLPELDAAREAMRAGLLRGELDVLGGWTWEPECDDRPFAFIPELYEQRRKWKREGVGAERALKLALNSLYGKTAQQIGGTSDKPPPFHQLEWAGWITAATRARLYRASIPALKRGRAIMYATDGLYSLDPLDLEDTGELGSWELQTHAGITVVQSGVYWLDQGERESLYCRGFDKPGRGQDGALSRANILAAWARGDKRYAATLTRFVTMGQALAGGDAWARWRQWLTEPRQLALYPETGKRRNGRPGKPWRELVPTRAREPEGFRPPHGPALSSPIAVLWDETREGWELLVNNRAEDEADAASE